MMDNSQLPGDHSISFVIPVSFIGKSGLTWLFSGVKGISSLKCLGPITFLFVCLCLI